MGQTMTSKRTLLIDADVVAFSCASACEQRVEWEPGHFTWNVNFEEVKLAVHRWIERAMDVLDATDYVLCLTDPEHNWRLDVMPTYKATRSGQKRPLVLMPTKYWMRDELDGKLIPTLEGDDVMGILATAKTKAMGERIIVSIDKDMKTIPGLYVRDVGKDPIEVSQADADRWHMVQSLAGDVTDGYDGCPGIGMDRAAKAIDAMVRKVPYEHELIRGPRKGQTETRYREEEADSLWDVVVSHYAAAGLGEEEALAQARVARILRFSDYDGNQKEPILWTPPN